MNPPVCQHLRTKKMFIPALTADAPGRNETETETGPCHYWCNCTLTEVGPDDQSVHPQVCQPERTCYQA